MRKVFSVCGCCLWRSIVWECVGLVHHTCSGSYTVRRYCNVKWVQLIYSSLLPVRLFLLYGVRPLFIHKSHDWNVLSLARLISWSCGMEYIRPFFVAHMVTWIRNISDLESYMLSNTHSDAGHFRVCYWTEGSPHIRTSQWALFLIPSIVQLATQQFLSCYLPFSLLF